MYGVMQVYPVCKFGINTCNALDNSFICRAALQFCTISQFSSVLAVAGNINVRPSFLQQIFLKGCIVLLGPEKRLLDSAGSFSLVNALQMIRPPASAISSSFSRRRRKPIQSLLLQVYDIRKPVSPFISLSTSLAQSSLNILLRSLV